MIHSSLLQLALWSQFFTGMVYEVGVPPDEYAQQNENPIQIDGPVSEGNLIVNEERTIQLSCDETDKIQTVYVDGQSIDSTTTAQIGPENEVLAIETEKGDSYVYPIEAVDMVEASVSVDNGAYSINPDPELILNENVDEPVSVVLLKDGSLIQKVSCSDQNVIQFHLDQSGQYGLHLEYDSYPMLRGRINGETDLHFNYSNKDPSIKIEQSERKEDGIDIHFLSDVDDKVKAYIRIDDGQSLQEYEEGQMVHLTADIGEHKIYKVQAEVLDAYGRKAEDHLEVEIDRKPPSIDASYNSTVLDQDKPFLISDLSLFHYEISDAANSLVSVYINDRYVSDTLEGIVLAPGDIASIQITAVDAHQNESSKQYILQMISGQSFPLPEVLTPSAEEVKDEKKVLEMTTSSQMPILNRSGDYVEVIRDWSVDANNTVVLAKEKKSIVDHTKPFVTLMYPESDRELKAGDKVRITILNTVDYSNDVFSKITVNGQKVDVSNLPKDDLNNQYWEFELEEGLNTIEAEARDDSSNITSFRETIQAKKKHQFPITGIAIAALLMAAGIWLKKHVESMDS